MRRDENKWKGKGEEIRETLMREEEAGVEELVASFLSCLLPLFLPPTWLPSLVSLLCVRLYTLIYFCSSPPNLAPCAVC